VSVPDYGKLRASRLAEYLTVNERLKFSVPPADPRSRWGPWFGRGLPQVRMSRVWRLRQHVLWKATAPGNYAGASVADGGLRTSERPGSRHGGPQM